MRHQSGSARSVPSARARVARAVTSWRRSHPYPARAPWRWPWLPAGIGRCARAGRARSNFAVTPVPRLGGRPRPGRGSMTSCPPRSPSAGAAACHWSPSRPPCSGSSPTRYSAGSAPIPHRRGSGHLIGSVAGPSSPRRRTWRQWPPSPAWSPSAQQHWQSAPSRGCPRSTSPTCRYSADCNSAGSLPVVSAIGQLSHIRLASLGIHPPPPIQA